MSEKKNKYQTKPEVNDDMESSSTTIDTFGFSAPSKADEHSRSRELGFLHDHEEALEVFKHLIEQSHNLLQLAQKDSRTASLIWSEEICLFFDAWAPAILAHPKFLPLLERESFFAQKHMVRGEMNVFKHFFWLGTFESSDEAFEQLRSQNLPEGIQDFLRVVLNSHLTKMNVADQIDAESSQVAEEPLVADKMLQVKSHASFLDIEITSNDPFEKLLVDLIWSLLHIYTLNILVRGDSSGNHNYARLQQQHRNSIEALTRDCVMGVGLCLNRIHALDAPTCMSGSGILNRIRKYSSDLFGKELPFHSTLSPCDLYPHLSEKLIILAQDLKWVKYKTIPLPVSSLSTSYPTFEPKSNIRKQHSLEATRSMISKNSSNTAKGKVKSKIEEAYEEGGEEEEEEESEEEEDDEEEEDEEQDEEGEEEEEEEEEDGEIKYDASEKQMATASQVPQSKAPKYKALGTSSDENAQMVKLKSPAYLKQSNNSKQPPKASQPFKFEDVNDDHLYIRERDSEPVEISRVSNSSADKLQRMSKASAASTSSNHKQTVPQFVPSSSRETTPIPQAVVQQHRSVLQPTTNNTSRVLNQQKLGATKP